MHEFERSEMEGYVAEVPEALGADKEIVQGIQPSFQCAAEAGRRALVLRSTAGQAPHRVAHPARSAGSRLSGVGDRPLHNQRATSLTASSAGSQGDWPTPRAEDKRVENGAPAIEDGRC